MSDSPDRPLVAVIVEPGGGMPPGLDALDDRAELRLCASWEQLEAIADEADILLVQDFRTEWVRDLGSRVRRVRWIHAASAGVDAAMPPNVRDSVITVTNAQGVFDAAIGEYVLGLLLSIAKDLHGSRDLQRGHRWEHRETRMLRGTRMLVVGAGSVGRAIAQSARAAGVAVDGLASRERQDDPDFGHVLSSDDLLRALPGADFVVIAAPLTEATRGMIDAEALAAIDRRAWLINVGRGPIVDQAALLEALEAGRIAGAALDVFQEEPLPAGSPLWDLPNVIVSPHMAGDFIGWEEALSRLFADNLERWRGGAPLRNLVQSGHGESG